MGAFISNFASEFPGFARFWHVFGGFRVSGILET